MTLSLQRLMYFLIDRSIEGLELAYLPVLKATIRKVPSDDKGYFLFAEFLFCDGQGIPIHKRVAVSGEVQWGVLRDLHSPDTNDPGLFILGHEGGGDSL